jgi:hypothetical protein
LHSLKVLGDLLMGFLASVKALPARANQPDELVSGVDGHDETTRDFSVTLDQYRLDVGLDRQELRIARDDAGPFIERQ